MKKLNLLNRSGMSPDVMSRKGRYNLDPILSRLCLVSLICLCMLTLGSGNVWGAYTYSGTGTFTKQATIDGDGYYVIIFTNSGAMTNSASSNYVGVNTGYNGTSSATISNPSTSVVLQVTNYDSTNKKYYINNNSGNYLYSSGDKKIEYSATSQYWEIATVNSKARLKTAQTTVVYMGYYSGSGFRPYTKSSSNVQSVSAIYKLGSSCTVAPTVGSDLTSVSTTTTSITATVPISAIGGCNITENGLVYSTSNTTPTVGGTNCTKVTVTACGSTAANKTVEITGLTCGTTYYVRGYATNGAGTSYTNVKTQATSDCPKYTVTLEDDGTELTQATAGTSVTLPSRAGCSGYTFAGWTKTWVAPQSSWTTTAPTIIEAGSYTPTANENLYPVYTKTESGGTVFSQYQQVSLGGTITAGKYLISTGTFTMAGSGKTGASFTPGTTEKTEYEYTIAISGGAITIKGPDNKYVGGTDTNDGLTFDAATPSTNQYKWTYNSTGIRNNSVTTRYIRAYSTTDFRHYKSGTGTTTYFYKRIETSGSTKSYISVPNCCATKVTLSGGSPSNGTVTFSPAGPIATCSATDADRQTVMTITPAAGYKLTAFSKTGPTPTMSADVATTGASSKAAQNITLTFAQDQATATYAVTATFTAMVDHYKDLLHSTSGYTGDGMSKSATYTVPSPGNASNPADDSCEELHYKFVGWVEESYVKSDGTLNTDYTLISGGSAGTASEKTYIAVWAKEL